MAPGGFLGGAAGLGDSLIGSLQEASCLATPEVCLLQMLSGVRSPLALYRAWVASQGVDTASGSTYTGGQILGAFLQTVAGGLIASAGEAAGIATEALASGIQRA